MHFYLVSYLIKLSNYLIHIVTVFKLLESCFKVYNYILKLLFFYIEVCLKIMRAVTTNYVCKILIYVLNFILFLIENIIYFLLADIFCEICV